MLIFFLIWINLCRLRYLKEHNLNVSLIFEETGKYIKDKESFTILILFCNISYFYRLYNFNLFPFLFLRIFHYLQKQKNGIFLHTSFYIHVYTSLNKSFTLFFFMKVVAVTFPSFLKSLLSLMYKEVGSQT